MNHVKRSRNQSNNFQMYISGFVKVLAASSMRYGFYSHDGIVFRADRVPFAKRQRSYRQAIELFLRWKFARIRNMSAERAKQVPLTFENFSIFLFHSLFLEHFLQLYFLHSNAFRDTYIKLLTRFFSVKSIRERRKVIKQRCCHRIRCP